MADRPRTNPRDHAAAMPSTAEQRKAAREQRRRAQKRRARLLVLGTVAVLVVLGVSAYALARVGAKRAEPTRPLASIEATESVTASTTAAATATATASTAASPEPTPTAPPHTYPTEGSRTIVVYKAEQHVRLFDETGQEVADYLCSTGRVDPVPGTYHVTSHKPSSSWEDKHFFHFTIFTKTVKGNNIGFHAIPLDAKGNPVGAEQLGQPVSAGCVRLEAENAKFLYDWAPNGTRVVVVK